MHFLDRIFRFRDHVSLQLVVCLNRSCDSIPKNEYIFVIRGATSLSEILIFRFELHIVFFGHGLQGEILWNKLSVR